MQKCKNVQFVLIFEYRLLLQIEIQPPNLIIIIEKIILQKQRMSAQEQASTVRCPYMPQHVMHVDSLLTHLNRCKATNKHMFRTCLYNSLHVVPRELYDGHIKRCEDAAKNRQQNEHQAWEEEKKGPNYNIHYNNVRDRSRNSSDDYSSQSWSCSESSDGYGYYGQLNKNELYQNKHQSQYNKVQPANHSSLSYDFDELSYLRPASTTPNPLKKKKGNKTTIEEDPAKNFYYGQAQRLNATFNILGNSVNDSKKIARVRNQSDRETYEQSDDRKLRFEIQQSRTNQKYIKTQDEEILSFLNQMDSKMSKASLMGGYNGDQLGDLLIEQASMLKSKRNMPNMSNISNISFNGRSGDGVGTLTRF